MAENKSTRDRRKGGQAANGSDLSDGLKESLEKLVSALAERVVGSAGDKVSGATERLTEYAEGGGGKGLMRAVTGAAEGESPVKSALGGAFKGVKEKAKDVLPGSGGGNGGGGGTESPKVINIVEDIDIGLPVRDVYNLWTQFQDFSRFMKKVESVEQVEDEKLKWTARIAWSDRNWESTIKEQVPDERIVWSSSGSKGYVDGAVTFHELAPDLTRVLLVLVYHPQGFFEKTANLWRAQGRRARLELKHFRRYAMTDTILHPEDTEGWRGEISDKQVVLSHEDALEEEQEGQSDGEQAEEDQAEDQAEDQDGESSDEDFDEAEDEEEAPEEEEEEEELEPAGA